MEISGNINWIISKRIYLIPLRFLSQLKYQKNLTKMSTTATTANSSSTMDPLTTKNEPSPRINITLEKPQLWNPRDHIPLTVQQLLNKPSPNYRLAFLNVIQQLKIQKRTGWLDYNMTECESIADHMYRMSCICMMITNPSVNRDKCMRIALVHDMAESIVGDITPVNPIGKKEKSRREWETIKYICEDIIKPINPVISKEIMEDWLSYENISSLEARYVKDIDKYELFVQCFEYEQEFQGTKNFDEFFQAVNLIKTDEVKQWVNELITLRDTYFKSLKT